MKVKNWLSLALTLGLSVTALKNCPVERMVFEVQAKSCGHCEQESEPGAKNFLCCTQPGALTDLVQAPSLDSASFNPVLASAQTAAITPDLAVHSLRQSDSTASPPRACPLRLTPRAPPA